MIVAFTTTANSDTVLQSLTSPYSGTKSPLQLEHNAECLHLGCQRLGVVICTDFMQGLNSTLHFFLSLSFSLFLTIWLLSLTHLP